MSENVFVQFGAEVRWIGVIKGKEVVLYRVIDHIIEAILKLGVTNLLNHAVPALNGRRKGWCLVNGQRSVCARSKLMETNCVESGRNQVCEPSVIPIKPCPDPSIAHGTKERLNAQSISNPADDVISITKGTSVIGDFTNGVAGLFSRTCLPNHLLLRIVKSESWHDEMRGDALSGTRGV